MPGLAVIHGLLAAGLAAWLLCPIPPAHRFSASRLLLFAVSYVLLVALSAAGAAWWNSRECQARGLPAIVCGLAWVAPLSVLLVDRSIWSVVAGIPLAVSVTRLLRSDPGYAGEPADSGRREMFDIPERTLRVRLFGPGASLCLQTGTLAGLSGNAPAAAALISIGSAVLAWNVVTPTRRPSRFHWRAVLVFAMSLALTAGGLAPYLQVRREFGPKLAHSGRIPHALAALLRIFIAPHSTTTERKRGSQGYGDREMALDFVHPGVILWPDVQSHVTLVPPAPSIQRSLFGSGRVERLSIPFYGVYWFLRRPDERPPVKSFTTHGNPSNLGFTATDASPLAMEAHQNFGTLIDLNCCSQIQIAISNGDRHPGTVSIELILLNTTLAGKPSQSLGSMPVTSTLHWRLYDDRPPVREILSFNVPPNPAIQQFDEAAIEFHLGWVRASHSAKIAIDRFTLVLHGATLAARQ